MSIRRYPPDHPLEWLNYARSDLALAQADIEEALPALQCFHAQQAAEKAIKAVLISVAFDFPYTHDLGHLAALTIEQGFAFPDELRQVTMLTQYAIVTRYPGAGNLVTEDEKQRAIEIAEQTIRWAESVIQEQTD